MNKIFRFHKNERNKRNFSRVMKSVIHTVWIIPSNHQTGIEEVHHWTKLNVSETESARPLSLRPNGPFDSNGLKRFSLKLSDIELDILLNICVRNYRSSRDYKSYWKFLYQYFVSVITLFQVVKTSRSCRCPVIFLIKV